MNTKLHVLFVFTCYFCVIIAGSKLETLDNFSTSFFCIRFIARAIVFYQYFRQFSGTLKK